MSDNLPPELWTEILVRLRVRTLLTLKSVSKSFLSLIENPSFASMHFARHKNHSDESEGHEYDLLFLELAVDPDCGREWQFVVRRSDTLMKTMQFNALIDYECAFEIEGYVNGFILIRKYASREIILWNPSIRKYAIIPSSPVSHLRLIDLGFGYDPVSNDYKVVAIMHSEAQSCRIIDVYQLSTGNWRTIVVDVMSNGWYLFQKVYFNGAMHWLAGYDDPGGYNISHIVSFDLGTEVISYIELPVEEEDDLLERKCRFPLVFSGSLAVFDISSIKSCLWVMEDKGWVKLYAGESPWDAYQLINGEFQVINNLVYSKNQELLFNPGSGLVSYNLESRELRTYIHDADCTTYIGNHVESLVWSGLFP